MLRISSNSNKRGPLRRFSAFVSLFSPLVSLQHLSRGNEIDMEQIRLFHITKEAEKAASRDVLCTSERGERQQLYKIGRGETAMVQSKDKNCDNFWGGEHG
jgi:hypothetical protein